jgi:hypothetical protein
MSYRASDAQCGILPYNTYLHVARVVLLTLCMLLLPTTWIMIMLVQTILLLYSAAIFQARIS